jgi:hypothetical protein
VALLASGNYTTRLEAGGSVKWFEKMMKAGRGRHLAPAPEVVSADASEHSPALLTKQTHCTHAFQQAAVECEICDRDDDSWIHIGVATSKIVSDSAEKMRGHP